MKLSPITSRSRPGWPRAARSHGWTPPSQNTIGRRALSKAESLMDKLEKLKGLLAHKNFSGSYEVLFEELADIAIKVLDPAAKPARKAPVKATQAATQTINRQSGAKSTTDFQSPNAPPPWAPQVDLSQAKDPVKNTRTTHSRYIPKEVRRKIWMSAEGKCQYQDPITGRKCESNHALEFDHIQPFAQGGPSTEENLRLFCDAHNRWRT